MQYVHGFPVDVWSALQVDSHYHLLPFKIFTVSIHTRICACTGTIAGWHLVILLVMIVAIIIMRVMIIIIVMIIRSIYIAPCFTGPLGFT